MNDKLKGMLIGMSVGVMLTGSIAFADSAQIEVALKHLKFMFDGKEVKQEAGRQSIVYDGTTYVPIRFVSEALGKEVTWDGENETIWIGKNPSAIVAKYKGGEVTTGELDSYISFMSLINPDNKQHEAKKDYQDFMLKQLIGYQLLYNRADDSFKSSLAGSYDEQLKQLEVRIPAQNDGADYDGLLAAARLETSNVKKYVELIVTAQKYLESQVSDARLKDLYDYELAFKSGQYTTASVRHILIGFTDANGKPRSKEDAKKRADEVLTMLKNGKDFAAIAKEYSDDPGSSQNGGLYENASVNNWVYQFRKAALEQQLNEIGGPVETTYGYHIIRVESRVDKSFDEVKDGLKQQTINNQYEQFLKNELPGQIESINLPK